MANGREHKVAGAMAGGGSVIGVGYVADYLGRSLIATSTEGVMLVAAGAAIGLVYGLLPDIDLRGTLSRSLGFVGAAITWVVRRISVATHGRAHRGLTHRPWFVVLAALPWLWLHPLLAVAAAAGGLSHLLLDHRVLRPLWRLTR